MRYFLKTQNPTYFINFILRQNPISQLIFGHYDPFRSFWISKKYHLKGIKTNSYTILTFILSLLIKILTGKGVV